MAAFGLLAAGCGGNPDRGELARLREENEELRARLEQLERENRQLRGQPNSPDKVYAHFANDAAEGSLAGLLVGDYLTSARSRYGMENRARSWTSEGRVIFEYEWDLEGGLVLRVDTNQEQRVERIAVALTGAQPVSLPTLLGLTLGQDTFATLEKRFDGALSTSLRLWGAQGLYTVGQTLALGDDRRMEFLYQMPDGLGRAELDRLEREVRQNQNPAALAPHLNDRVPFLVALERPR